jgi:hypothetical protein
MFFSYSTILFNIYSFADLLMLNSDKDDEKCDATGNDQGESAGLKTIN